MSEAVFASKPLLFGWKVFKNRFRWYHLSIRRRTLNDIYCIQSQVDLAVLFMLETVKKMNNNSLSGRVRPLCASLINERAFTNEHLPTFIRLTFCQCVFYRCVGSNSTRLDSTEWMYFRWCNKQIMGLVFCFNPFQFTKLNLAEQINHFRCVFLLFTKQQRNSLVMLAYNSCVSNTRCERAKKKVNNKRIRRMNEHANKQDWLRFPSAKYERIWWTNKTIG